MSFFTDLYAHLDTIGLSSTIYGDVAPQGAAVPYITLELGASDREYYIGGDTGLTHQDVSIIIWGKDKADLETDFEVLRDKLSGFRSQLNSSTEVRRCHLVGEVWETVNPTDGTELPPLAVRVTFSISYIQAVPTATR